MRAKNPRFFPSWRNNYFSRSGQVRTRFFTAVRKTEFSVRRWVVTEGRKQPFSSAGGKKKLNLEKMTFFYYFLECSVKISHFFLKKKKLYNFFFLLIISWSLGCCQGWCGACSLRESTCNFGLKNDGRGRRRYFCRCRKYLLSFWPWFISLLCCFFGVFFWFPPPHARRIVFSLFSLLPLPLLPISFNPPFLSPAVSGSFSVASALSHFLPLRNCSPPSLSSRCLDSAGF